MSLTRQEIFNKAYTGLMEQNFVKSTISGDIGFCCYRMGDLKCAMGHVLPDDKYNPDMDTDKVNFGDILLACDIDFEDASFCRHLQSCHDYSDCPQDMGARLRAFANENGLTVPEVTNV